MIRAVYDCNLIFSAIGWKGAARACLKLAAERKVFLYTSREILMEYYSVIPEAMAEEMPEIDPLPMLNWVKSKSRLVEPADLGKQRSRDEKDDIYLAAAVSASANFIVTYDKDLLVLEKPFGIEIIRPPAFLRRIPPSED